MCSDASMGIKISVGKIYSDRKVTCVVHGHGQTDVLSRNDYLRPRLSQEFVSALLLPNELHEGISYEYELVSFVSITQVTVHTFFDNGCYFLFETR